MSRLLKALFVTLLAMVLVYIGSCAFQSHRYAMVAEKYGTIKEGMLEEEVIQILGSPQKRMLIGRNELERYLTGDIDRVRALQATHKELYIIAYSHRKRTLPLISRSSGGIGLNIFFDSDSKRIVYVQIRFLSLFN